MKIQQQLPLKVGAECEKTVKIITRENMIDAIFDGPKLQKIMGIYGIPTLKGCFCTL